MSAVYEICIHFCICLYSLLLLLSGEASSERGLGFSSTPPSPTQFQPKLWFSLQQQPSQQQQWSSTTHLTLSSLFFSFAYTSTPQFQLLWQTVAPGNASTTPCIQHGRSCRSLTRNCAEGAGGSSCGECCGGSIYEVLPGEDQGLWKDGPLCQSSEDTRNAAGPERQGRASSTFRKLLDDH